MKVDKDFRKKHQVFKDLITTVPKLLNVERTEEKILYYFVLENEKRALSVVLVFNYLHFCFEILYKYKDMEEQEYNRLYNWYGYYGIDDKYKEFFDSLTAEISFRIQEQKNEDRLKKLTK